MGNQTKFIPMKPKEGHRYNLSPVAWSSSCKEGVWLFDPNHKTVPLVELERAENKIGFLENQVSDLADALHEVKSSLRHLEKIRKNQPLTI